MHMLHLKGFPETELSALILRGELFSTGEFYFPFDISDSSIVRANALASDIEPNFWAERQSALWVYGFGDSPQLPQIATAPNHRSGSFQKAKISHIVISQVELVKIGNLTITCPIRTLIDCLSRPKNVDPVATAALAKYLGVPESLTLEAPISRSLREKFQQNLVAINSINVVNSIDSANSVQNAIKMRGVTHFENIAA